MHKNHFRAPSDKNNFRIRCTVNTLLSRFMISLFAICSVYVLHIHSTYRIRTCIYGPV